MTIAAKLIAAALCAGTAIVLYFVVLVSVPPVEQKQPATATESGFFRNLDKQQDEKHNHTYSATKR